MVNHGSHQKKEMVPLSFIGGRQQSAGVVHGHLNPLVSIEHWTYHG